MHEEVTGEVEPRPLDKKQVEKEASIKRDI